MAVSVRTLAFAAVAVSATAHARGGADAPLAYLAVSEGYWEVWLSNPDGTGARQLTHSRNDKTRLSWFPDGSALLACSNDGRVVKVDLQGRETKIVLEQFPVVDAVLSPDGRHLAYSFSTAIDGNDIWIANLDGTGAQRLVKMASLQHEPVWSADGAQIYFLSGDGGQAHDIWRVSLQSRAAEQLTVGSLYHFDIAVSAAGDLAYSSNRGGNYEIYLQRRGGEPEALTDDPALDGRPAFSPDGNSLIFESTRDGAPNLWRIDLRSRVIRQVTRHHDGARAPVWYQGAGQ
jgi:TolB protein